MLSFFNNAKKNLFATGDGGNRVAGTVRTSGVDSTPNPKVGFPFSEEVDVKFPVVNGKRRAAAELFAKAVPTCTGIFIRNAKYASSHISNGGFEGLLKRLQVDIGGPKADAITTTFVGSERNKIKSLSLQGYEIIASGPRVSFSRIRDIQADAWYAKAFDSADGFVYHITVKDFNEYIEDSGTGYSRGRGWEVDRFEIARMLRTPSVVENPKKPFLLLIECEQFCMRDDDEIDVDRIVNLVGLGARGITRPFRAMAFYKNRRNDTDTSELKEAFGWLKNMAGKGSDEVTAVTENETDEDISVDTNSSMTMLDDDALYVLDYEPTLLGGNATLQRFEPIKKGTHCPFARAARLWGGKLADETKPTLYRGREDRYYRVKEAAMLNAGPLAEFVSRSDNGEPLDGFCMQIPAPAWRTPEQLGEAVRHLLTKLSELDPSPGENAMKMGQIDKPHWRFRFAGEDFFITTFSPVYEKNSSRYAFKAQHAFALFQPIKSFGRHGLTEDTPESATNWDDPKTMRDKARVAYKKNGRSYYIPEELPYPVAEHIVKPHDDDGKKCIRWWEPLENRRKSTK